MIRDLLKKTGHIFFAVIIFIAFSNVHAQDQLPGKRIIIDGEEFFLHVVDQGQGFFSIARQYNVSQQEILEANPGIESGLKEGQVVRIPVIEGRNTSQREIEESDDFILHTVEKGQTAWYISQKYDVPLQEIYKHNPGAERQLTVGSIIKVPANKVTSINNNPSRNQDGRFRHHEVKPGDTLFSLSQRYNVTVDDIIAHNPALKNGVLTIGSIVRIPRESDQATSGEENKADKPFVTGENYVYHEIKDGQTLYSISRKYQVEVQTIKKHNPDIQQNDLERGYMLRIPKSSTGETNKSVAEEKKPDKKDLFDQHRVRRRETLFSISREYDVDMETIRKVNPTVDFSDLKRGTDLKIPTDTWFAHRYRQFSEEDKTTSFSEGNAEETYQFSTDSMCNNPEGIGRRRPARVALLLPFALDATDQANILEKVEDGDTVRVKMEERIVARRSRIFAEFYEGILLALDDLKKQNIDVDLSVYDLASDSMTVQEILRQNREIRDVDLIIGPARSDDLGPVAEFARRHEIKVVYPLSNVNPELKNNPYLFQINTPDSLVFGRMTNESVRQANGHNLLVVLPEENDRYASGFLHDLRKKVFFSQFTLNRDISYREYHMTGRDDQTNLEALLRKDKKNVVVVPTNKEATISKIVPTLAGISENRHIDISLFVMT